MGGGPQGPAGAKHRGCAGKGGLDSAHALVIAVEGMDQLGLPRRNVLACTMPGFATSEAMLSHARQLMTALGATRRRSTSTPPPRRCSATSATQRREAKPYRTA